MTELRADRSWLELPGVPESQLSPDLTARLACGEGGPPAPPPWRTRVQAVLWWHRAAPKAAEWLPGATRGLPTLPITVGAFVRYLESPVGPYSEVFASPVLIRRAPLPAISVPFIAVDSVPSIVGGRAGWGLPKTLASVQWQGLAEIRCTGDDWSVGARIAARGPRLPIAGPLPLLQPKPDGGPNDRPTGGVGRSAVRLTGWFRPARATIEVSGPSLPEWLLPGPHPALAISSGVMHISAARPAAARAA